MYSPTLAIAILLSLLTHASKGSLIALSKNGDGDIEYATNFLGLIIESSRMICSFISFKVTERKGKHVRYHFSVKDILSMSMPAWINASADTIYFYLINVLNDELIVQAFSSLEIVVIGIASYLILGRRLSGVHWSAILLLCTSITSMQIDSCPTCSFTEFPLLPSLIALFCAGLEGLHGVIKENILKRYKGADIAQINTWMYFWGSIAHFFFSIFETGSAFTSSLSFSHFNAFGILLIISDTVKGIAGTYIYRYADSIVEALVHCASLVVATLMIAILFGKKITYPFRIQIECLNRTFSFVIAIVNLCIATLLYESSPVPEGKPILRIGSEEELPGQKVADSIEIE